MTEPIAPGPVDERVPLYLDLSGLKCPQPVIRLAMEARRLPPGTIVDMLATCEDFPDDVRRWTTAEGRALLWCNDVDGVWNARIIL